MRLDLLHDICQRFGSEVPSGIASLWVFPGGYFGFDATKEKNEKFFGLADQDLRRIKNGLVAITQALPPHSVIAVGVDRDEHNQHVWVAEGKRSEVSQITRRKSKLADRVFAVGSRKAAFFVCGEFPGSHTDKNGPFCDDGEERFLDDPLNQLPECDLLVDLAHHQVSGSISGSCSRWWVHRRQMELFSQRGISVLAHYHAGQLVDGRAHYKHQSNWIVFRESTWLLESAVTPVDAAGC